MTDERKNEIWAMLTPDERNKIKAGYKAEIGARFYNEGYNSALENIFGSHNLTAPAEEKPKEPRFKVGDLVRVLANTKQMNTIGKVTATYPGHHCMVNGYVYEPSELELYTDGKISEENNQNSLDVAENVETSAKEDAYFAYRLDLAKEIAVAEMNMLGSVNACGIVQVANEIVKRLKETEE